MRTWAEISLDAIKNNISEVRRITEPSAKVYAVVKADAYGHGVFQSSKVMLQNGADGLCVAFSDEAVQLRMSGIDAPILILGYTPKEEMERVVEHDIMPTVFDLDSAKNLSREAERQNKTVRIHIKIDTGMSRVGFVFCEDEEVNKKTEETIAEIAKLPNIFIEGAFTHFASSDEKDRAFTDLQFGRFCSLMKRLEAAGINIPTKHVCNSAGIIQFPEMHLDMVRAGIVLYGCYPSDEVDKSKINLMPAMQLKAKITNVKEVAAGVPVSYGRTYTTSAPTKIATVPIGYADGFSRILSGKAKMIAGGKIYPVIGRICMDQCMIDVTGVNNISVGDEAVIFGKAGNSEITVSSVAEQMGTINYELLCLIGKRVPRVYIESGKTVAEENWLLKSIE